MQMRTLHWVVLLTGILIGHGVLAQGASADEPCIPIDRAGYVIDKPGRYCVVKDLHTRLDFADHPAEHALVEIRSSDVTLDLQGHRLGTGRFFPQPDYSNGIVIGGKRYQSDAIENLRIMNGRVTDVRVGIYFYRSDKNYVVPTINRPLKQLNANTYLYETSNIVIKDVVFERCKVNFSFNDWAASREIFLREKDATQETFNPK
jgi:hypothetical protein